MNSCNWYPKPFDCLRHVAALVPNVTVDKHLTLSPVVTPKCSSQNETAAVSRGEWTNIVSSFAPIGRAIQAFSFAPTFNRCSRGPSDSRPSPIVGTYNRRLWEIVSRSSLPNWLSAMNSDPNGRATSLRSGSWKRKRVGLGIPATRPHHASKEDSSRT